MHCSVSGWATTNKTTSATVFNSGEGGGGGGEGKVLMTAFNQLFLNLKMNII